MSISHCVGPLRGAGNAGLGSRGEDGAELGRTRMAMAARAFPFWEGLRPRLASSEPCGFCLHFAFWDDARFWSSAATGMAGDALPWPPLTGPLLGCMAEVAVRTLQAIPCCPEPAGDFGWVEAASARGTLRRLVPTSTLPGRVPTATGGGFGTW